MQHLRLGLVYDFIARLPDGVTKVQIFRVHEIALIKPADIFKHMLWDHHARAGDGVHLVALPFVQIPKGIAVVLFRVLFHAAAEAGKIAKSVPRRGKAALAAMIQRAVFQIDARACSADAPILRQGIRQRLDGAVIQKAVGIDKQQQGRHRLARAQVAGVPKAVVLRFDEPVQKALAQLFLRAGGIVHHDDLQLQALYRGPGPLHGAQHQLFGIEIDEDCCYVCHRCLPLCLIFP